MSFEPENISPLLPQLPPYIEERLKKLQDDTVKPSRRSKCMTAYEKEAFIRKLIVNKFRWYKTCEQLGWEPNRMKLRVEADRDFKAALHIASSGLVEEIRAVSLKQALKPEGFSDRQLQLKALQPTVYGRSDQQVAAVQVNLDMGNFSEGRSSEKINKSDDPPSVADDPPSVAGDPPSVTETDKD